MKKIIYTLLVAVISVTSVSAQKFISKNAHLSFFSTTAVEDIEALNKKASAIIDSETGQVVVSALMKSFEFEKALMQEHFNENYVESDKFPKTKFNGEITNLKEIDFTSHGEYKALVKGGLTIHGVTKPVETEMIISISDKGLNVNGKFIVSPTDYDINIPSVVKDKIAKELDVTVDMDFVPFKK